MVKINDAHIKRTFEGRTDMSWQDFSDIAYARFRKPHDDILMGYKFASAGGGLTELTSEVEWKKAIVRTKQKIETARTHVVAMEVKNMVSDMRALDHKKTLTFCYST